MRRARLRTLLQALRQESSLQLVALVSSTLWVQFILVSLYMLLPLISIVIAFLDLLGQTRMLNALSINDNTLADNVVHAFHAVALHENRDRYGVTMLKVKKADVDSGKRVLDQVISSTSPAITAYCCSPKVWFAGVCS